MSGEMNSLKDVDYTLSHDIQEIDKLSYQQLATIKSEIELELNKSFEALQKVSLMHNS